jgi:hypothetical protein
MLVAKKEPQSMKVAILGATGFVGSALLKEALDRGHTVAAIVRQTDKLEKHEGLTAKVSDVYDTASLAAAIRGNDAVISAFNPGWHDPNLYEDQVRGTTSIAAAIKDAGIKRVLWVGGAGGLEVKPGVRVIDNPEMPLGEGQRGSRVGALAVAVRPAQTRSSSRRSGCADSGRDHSRMRRSAKAAELHRVRNSLGGRRLADIVGQPDGDSISN